MQRRFIPTIWGPHDLRKTAADGPALPKLSPYGRQVFNTSSDIFLFNEPDAYGPAAWPEWPP
tara:strand:- start:410 stop:595 length:186 start_codon:yes stop_codon:yes gene_type:complete